MTIGKVLLYYCFTPIEDPTAIMLWQRTLCESLGLKGRILISEHGINAVSYTHLTLPTIYSV